MPKNASRPVKIYETEDRDEYDVPLREPMFRSIKFYNNIIRVRHDP